MGPSLAELDQVASTSAPPNLAQYWKSWAELAGGRMTATARLLWGVAIKTTWSRFGASARSPARRSIEWAGVSNICALVCVGVGDSVEHLPMQGHSCRAQVQPSRRCRRASAPCCASCCSRCGVAIHSQLALCGVMPRRAAAAGTVAPVRIIFDHMLAQIGECWSKFGPNVGPNRRMFGRMCCQTLTNIG